MARKAEVALTINERIAHLIQR